MIRFSYLWRSDAQIHRNELHYNYVEYREKMYSKGLTRQKRLYGGRKYPGMLGIYCIF